MGIFGEEPQQARVADVDLHCEICKHDRFHHRRAQLHSGVASFLNVEWAGPNADCFVCARCGYIHWFLPV